MPSRRSLQKSFVSTLLCVGQFASASLVYVSSYGGTVTTLNYTAGVCSGITKLQPVSVSKQCSDNPTWLTLDYPDARLFCLNEGLNTPNGSLTSFQTNTDGSLKQLNQVSTPNGPVSGVVYGSNRRGLALAHYGAGSFSTWDVSNPNHIKHVETKQYHLTKPGADPDRQEANHPHEAILDPTGKFLLVPDLGADLIHLYSFDDRTLKLKDLTPVSVKPGSGPRHLAFVNKGKKTFAYLVTELGNTIIGYEVTYPKGSIQLKQIFSIPSHGQGSTVPSGAAVSEIIISPDSNYAIVSSRAENDLTVPNFDDPSTTIASDPIINFSIDANTGALKAFQTVPAGGRFPRQFAINKAGNLLAVGMQFDARVVFIERDVKSGRLGNFVAYSDIAGNITSTFFDE